MAKVTGKQQYLNFDIVKKVEQSNATVDELRTGIWAPIERISSTSITYKQFLKNDKKRYVKTSWGEVVIKGNILTQIHRDLIDCIIAESDQALGNKKDEVALYFKLDRVLKKYRGGEGSTTDHKWLRKMLDQIQTTAIEFRPHDSGEGESDFYSFIILSAVAYSSKEKTYFISFSKEYIDFIEKKVTVNYIDDLDKLLTVKSPLLRAIIRFFWSHEKQSRMPIEKLLSVVGYPVESSRAIATAKKDIRDNLDVLESFGIVYNKVDNLFYKKESVENSIKFYPAKSQIALQR